MAARQLLSPTRIGFFGILLRDSFYFDAIVIIIFLDFSKFLSKGFCQHSPDVIRNLQRTNHKLLQSQSSTTSSLLLKATKYETIGFHP